MTRSSQKSPHTFPRYGEIWDANFDPVVGTEIAKRRPCLIVSNDLNNQFTTRVTVLPLNSRPIKAVYPFEVSIPKGTAGLTADSRILANQIRTFDQVRLINFRGVLPEDLRPKIEQAIKTHLNIE